MKTPGEFNVSRGGINFFFVTAVTPTGAAVRLSRVAAGPNRAVPTVDLPAVPFPTVHKARRAAISAARSAVRSLSDNG
jgi:hypothetical protein